MTLDPNCLTKKNTECEKTQQLEKNKCKDSGDYNKIKECTSDADIKFESCKDQAEIYCKTKKPDTQNNNASNALNTSTLLSETSPISSTQQQRYIPTTTPPPSLPPLPQSSPTPASRGLGTDAIIGIGATVGILCLCGIGAMYYYYKYKRNANKRSTTLQQVDNTNITANQGSLETQAQADSDGSPRSLEPQQGVQDSDGKSCLTGSNETPKTPDSTNKEQPSNGLTTRTTLQQDDNTNITANQRSLETQAQANSDTIPRSLEPQQGAQDSDDESCLTENNNERGIEYSYRTPKTQTPSSTHREQPSTGLRRVGNITFSDYAIEKAKRVLADYNEAVKSTNDPEKGSAEAEEPISSYDSCEEGRDKTTEDKIGAAGAESSSEVNRVDDNDSGFEEIIADCMKKLIEEVALDCKKTEKVVNSQGDEQKTEPPHIMTPLSLEPIPPSELPQQTKKEQEKKQDVFNFWQKLDSERSQKEAATKISFIPITPNESPDKLKSAAQVSPGQRGGHQV